MKTSQSKRMPLPEFLKEASSIIGRNITRRTIYHYLNKRQWYDGFVIFKNKATGRWEEGSLSDFDIWRGATNGYN